MVTINGSAHECEGQTVAQFLEAHSYNLQRVAVERNGQIVIKAQYASTVLCDGDTVEVVNFVGGG